MRTCFISTESREYVERICPWAAVIVDVDGGFIAFESQTDFETWENQR